MMNQDIYTKERQKTLKCRISSRAPVRLGLTMDQWLDVAACCGGVVLVALLLAV